MDFIVNTGDEEVVIPKKTTTSFLIRSPWQHIKGTHQQCFWKIWERLKQKVGNKWELINKITHNVANPIGLSPYKQEKTEKSDMPPKFPLESAFMH